MNTRAIAMQYRLQQWAGIIQDCKESGLSIREYSKNAGFHENRYYYWQKKLREVTCEELARANPGQTSLAPIEAGCRTPVIWAGIGKRELGTTATPISRNITISRDGWAVTVEPGFDPVLLAEALRVVSRVCYKRHP